MAFPAGWPPRVATGIRSIRVYVTGTATATYADNAYLFSQVTSANTFGATPHVPSGQESAAPGWAATALPAPPMGGGADTPWSANPDPKLNPPVPTQPTPMIWAKAIKITNLDMTNTLLFSFDGTHDQGQVLANSTFWYFDRYEAGIAFKGNGNFVLEAW